MQKAPCLEIIHSRAEGVLTRAHALAAGLVLRIFLALLPWLLAIMGRVQGLYSQSMLDFSVVTKYYVFQARSGAPSFDPCATRL